MPIDYSKWDKFECSDTESETQNAEGQKTSDETPPVALPDDELEHHEMIEFEKADLQEERGYAVFEKLWGAKSKAMVAHALASYGIFQWNGFRAWLKTKAASDDFAKASLSSFAARSNLISFE